MLIRLPPQGMIHGRRLRSTGCKPMDRSGESLKTGRGGGLMDRGGLIRVYGALLAAMLIWGFSFLAIKDAVRTTLIKDVLRRVTPLQLTFYQFFFSLFVFGPLAAMHGFSWLEGLTLKVTGEILFLGVLCSAGAFFAMHYALTRLSATQVAVAANLVPIVTLIAEASLLGIGLTLAKGLGTLLTIAGVIITQRGTPPEPLPVRGG